MTLTLKTKRYIIFRIRFFRPTCLGGAPDQK
jgi:hypothetical protein